MISKWMSLVRIGWDVFMKKDKEQGVLQFVAENAEEGNPESVLSKIDEYAYSQSFLINIGDEKGKILDETVKTATPKIAIELGAYCGYSAIRIARLLPEGGLLISIEKSALFAAIATKMVELAGLSAKVKILIGTADNWIPKLKERFKFEHTDFIFIDHWKDRYLPDLKIIETSGILREGTTIVADNVLFPGTPDYLEYIRNCGNYETKLHKSTLEYNANVEDGVEVSIYKQPKGSESVQK